MLLPLPLPCCCYPLVPDLWATITPPSLSKLFSNLASPRFFYPKKKLADLDNCRNWTNFSQTSLRSTYSPVQLPWSCSAQSPATKSRKPPHSKNELFRFRSIKGFKAFWGSKDLNNHLATFNNHTRIKGWVGYGVTRSLRKYNLCSDLVVGGRVLNERNIDLQRFPKSKCLIILDPVSIGCQ